MAIISRLPINYIELFPFNFWLPPTSMFCIWNKKIIVCAVVVSLFILAFVTEIIQLNDCASSVSSFFLFLSLSSYAMTIIDSVNQIKLDRNQCVPEKKRTVMVKEQHQRDCDWSPLPEMYRSVWIQFGQKKKNRPTANWIKLFIWPWNWCIFVYIFGTSSRNKCMYGTHFELVVWRSAIQINIDITIGWHGLVRSLCVCVCVVYNVNIRYI